MTVVYRKRINAAIIDQSVGRGTHATKQKSTYGPYHEDPILPEGTDGSFWPYICSRLAIERGVAVRLSNTAVGSTSIIEHWTDYTGTLGGSAVPLGDGDGGFPPANGYLQAAIDALTVSNGADENWLWVTGPGQRDRNLDTLPSEFKAALISAVGYVLSQASDIYCALGFTVYPASLNAADLARYNGFADAAWEAATELNATYPGRVFRGPRGTDLWDPDETPLKDTVHLDDDESFTYADYIFRKLVETGRL